MITAEDYAVRSRASASGVVEGNSRSSGEPMTVTPEIEAEIIRLFHAEHWPRGTIASQLGLHHSTVRRVLDKNGLSPKCGTKPSKVDPYLPFILEA